MDIIRHRFPFNFVDPHTVLERIKLDQHNYIKYEIPLHELKHIAKISRYLVIESIMQKAAYLTSHHTFNEDKDDFVGTFLLTMKVTFLDDFLNQPCEPNATLTCYVTFNNYSIYGRYSLTARVKQKDVITIENTCKNSSSVRETTRGGFDTQLLEDDMKKINAVATLGALKKEFSIPPGLALFDGHFENEPIFPAVMQMQLLDDLGKIPKLCKISCKLSLPILPGEAFRIEETSKGIIFSNHQGRLAKYTIDNLS